MRPPLEILAGWRQREQLRKTMAVVILAISLTLILFAIVVKFSILSPLTIVLILLAAIFLTLFFIKPWQVSREKIASIVDQQYPLLEESTNLLYRESNSLNLLEQLQVNKTALALQEIEDPFPLWPVLKKPIIFLAGAIFLSLLIGKMPVNVGKVITGKQETDSFSQKQPEIIPPEIVQSTITITPPPYTGKPSRRLSAEMSFEIEEGGSAKWVLRTKGASRLILLWNNKPSFTFSQIKEQQYSGAKSFTSSGFYQLEIDGKPSDVYAIEVIKDMPPSAKLTRPSSNITIDFGQPRSVNISGHANDDYGIVSAQLYTTIATGQGEGVKFRDQQYALHNPGRARVYQFSKMINMDALNMSPGDELFYFVEVKDAKGQLARTEAQTVSLKDTAELMSLQGFSTGVNIMPEYFRSQRQIIMDTEKLIREKSGLSQQEFKERSNNIGIDQKLLRLRYGKFLGEENEETIGSHDNEAEDHEGHDHAEVDAAENFNDRESILAEITHVHDRAEDATFFDAKTKTQLKNTLTEMWKAELQLRTFKPEQALPFEYKALVLLKDLQQKDRAYVAKTTYTTPPLAYDKRMTGDLSKAVSPVWQNKNTVSNRKNELKVAAGIIQNIKPKIQLSAEEKKQLMTASAALMEGAAQSPKSYLQGVRAAREILNAGKATARQVAQLGSALQMLIGNQDLPQKEQEQQTGSLGRSYFNNLKSGNP